MIRFLEHKLIKWKEHLPILFRGARHVGKSYLAEHSGGSHFDDRPHDH